MSGGVDKIGRGKNEDRKEQDCTYGEERKRRKGEARVWVYCKLRKQSS